MTTMSAWLLLSIGCSIGFVAGAMFASWRSASRLQLSFELNDPGHSQSDGHDILATAVEGNWRQHS
jgi:hypothetical protein